MASLHLLDGSGFIDLTVPGIYTLGRDPGCDFVIDHVSVSGVHALLEVQPGFLMIRDQGSTNGVRVNYAEVGSECLLDGDVLELGNVSYNVIGPELVANDRITTKTTQEDASGLTETNVKGAKEGAVASDLPASSPPWNPILQRLLPWQGTLMNLVLLILSGMLLFQLLSQEIVR